MFGITPEVVVVLAVFGDQRNAVVRVKHLKDALLRLLERWSRQHLVRTLILLGNPGERLLASDIFKPDELVNSGIVMDQHQSTCSLKRFVRHSPIKAEIANPVRSWADTQGGWFLKTG